MTVADAARLATPPVGENVGRLKSELRRDPAAMAALRAMGLSGSTIDRLHLGLKPPYRSRADGLETRAALCFPVLGDDLRPLGRYGYLNLPGVTENPHDPVGWGPGRPLVYRLGSFAADAVAVVTADVVDAWLAWQRDRGDGPGISFLSRSQPGGWPAEWMSPEWWAGFSKVVLLPGRGAADFLREVAPRIGRELRLATLPPHCRTLSDLGAVAGAAGLGELIDGAEAWTPEVPAPLASVPQDRLGRFAAAPVAVTAAWSGEHLYHPFVVESRELERVGADGRGRVVHAWETMVLRSDGLVLTAHALPAPRGSPASARVMALSDGTRILAPPIAASGGTWSFASITRFVEWRTAGGTPPFRELSQLLEDVEWFLRSRVWLPVDGHYLLAALYVAMSHIYQVFDAIPLLLVVGPAGTGKSELGEAIARLSLNGVVAGQLRAAGMIRLLDETRGLLVLDDMDGDGSASVTGSGELAQALKTSYKRSTSRKPIADRGGRVRMVDFYGPKVITSIRGVDAVLGSRMFAIATDAAPTRLAMDGPLWDDALLDGLRDELHCWAMATAADVAPLAAVGGRGALDRRAEIETPLLLMAEIAGPRVASRLRAALTDPRTLPAGRISG